MTLSIKRANEMKDNISNNKDDSSNHSDDFCVKSDDGRKYTVYIPAVYEEERQKNLKNKS